MLFPRVSSLAPAIALAVLLGPGPASALAQGGDPGGSRNVAETSELPNGPGLAAAYPNDHGIAGHSAVIFSESFEESGYEKRWDETRDPDGKVLLLDKPDDPRLGDQCLKVTARLGENTGGGLTRWFEPADRVFIRFYVRFDTACDYVHHFCTLRANRALSGGDRWSGFGGAGERPGGGRRFSTALEPWGNWGEWEPPGQWNFYSYWHTMEASPDKKFWGNAFRPAGQAPIAKGEWICAEFMLAHNTPGRDDGEQAYWIDGVLRGHWKAINWRSDATLKANAFTLESYVTDRWTKNPVNIVWFDQVVIASEYVGPIPRPDLSNARASDSSSHSR